MSKIALSPLTLSFHEPDHHVLGSSKDAVLDNVRWELSNVRAARNTAVGGSRVALAARERTLSSILTSADQEMWLLNNWRVELNPYVDPVEVGQLYQHTGQNIPAVVGQLMTRFTFYYLIFGGNLFVAQGATPKLLRLALAFSSDLPGCQGQVKVFDIFPKTEWKQWGKLAITFGVTAELGFKVPLNVSGLPFSSIGEVSPQAKAELVVGPVGFSFQKAEVLGAGKGNYIVDWRIKKGDILQGGDFEVYVILQVPKGLGSVMAHGEMEARVRLPGFIAKIFGKEKPFYDSQDYLITLPTG